MQYAQRRQERHLELRKINMVLDPSLPEECPSLDKFCGLALVRLCTAKYLRDTARMIFDARIQHHCVCAIHVKNERLNMIYEGVTIDSWSSCNTEESIGFSMENKSFFCAMKDVISIHLLYFKKR